MAISACVELFRTKIGSLKRGASPSAAAAVDAHVADLERQAEEMRKQLAAGALLLRLALGGEERGCVLQHGASSTKRPLRGTDLDSLFKCNTTMCCRHACAQAPWMARRRCRACALRWRPRRLRCRTAWQRRMRPTRSPTSQVRALAMLVLAKLVLAMLMCLVQAAGCEAGGSCSRRCNVYRLCPAATRSGKVATFWGPTLSRPPPSRPSAQAAPPA